ncbi:hypothetical protein [Actinoplanes sp. HUAS TT8]|uniref:hypothetical protein n=1 Tax=Actinoplanes sp. HUAS TT8 TaxID=3447453 RepID=UPI003F52828D
MQQQPSSPEPSLPAEPSGPMEEAEAVAVDVTGQSLLEIFHEPDSELAESMRKLVNEVKYRQATVSSFGSFLQ